MSAVNDQCLLFEAILILKRILSPCILYMAKGNSTDANQAQRTASSRKHHLMNKLTTVTAIFSPCYTAAINPLFLLLLLLFVSSITSVLFLSEETC